MQFIFPGIGLGAVVCGSKRITTQMFARAAEVLASCVPESNLKLGKVYPGIKSFFWKIKFSDISDIRNVSVKIAVEICKIAQQRKLNTKDLPIDAVALEELVKSKMYVPEHSPYVFARN